MQSEDTVSGEDFFNLLYADEEFTSQLGRAMMAASKFETELKLYLAANSIPLKKRSNLGDLIDQLNKHNLLPKLHPHIEMFRNQRNYLAHSLYELLTGIIEETLLPSTDLISMDVHVYTERVNQLEYNLIGFADIVKKERLKTTKGATLLSPQNRPPGRPHIANINFAMLYLPAFANIKESQKFVDQVESTPKNNAKVILHQAGRMIWLGDQIDKVAAGRPALQILFFMIAAEAVAKMVFDYKDEGKSKAFSKRFFSDICDERHRKTLGAAFAWGSSKAFPRGGLLSWEETTELLYAVRCDVAHRGKYYDLHLKQQRDSEQTDVISHKWKDRPIIARITLQDIRRIVLQGAIRGCRKVLENCSSEYAQSSDINKGD